jgi:hypothetical protein
MKETLEDIEYFKSYKRNLYQFIISNCCYRHNAWLTLYDKKQGRIFINHRDMLQILKEISRVEIHVYKLKTKFSFLRHESY